jgi:hypothetical protein
LRAKPRCFNERSRFEFKHYLHEETTMKNAVHRQVLLAIGSAVLMATPLMTQAKSEIGMDACLNAFVSEEIPEGHPVKIVKLDSVSGWMSPRNSTIEITAKGRRSGDSYGAATCVVNRKGELVAMHIHDERARYADGGALKQEPRG